MDPPFSSPVILPGSPDKKPSTKPRSKNRKAKPAQDTSIPTNISSVNIPHESTSSCAEEDTNSFRDAEKAVWDLVEKPKTITLTKPLRPKRTWKDFLPKYVQLVMFFVFIAVFVSIKMMPSKYMVFSSPFSPNGRDIPKPRVEWIVKLGIHATNSFLQKPAQVQRHTPVLKGSLLARISMSVISSIKTAAPNSSIQKCPRITSLAFLFLKVRSTTLVFSFLGRLPVVGRILKMKMALPLTIPMTLLVFPMLRMRNVSAVQTSPGNRGRAQKCISRYVHSDLTDVGFPWRRLWGRRCHLQACPWSFPTVHSLLVSDNSVGPGEPVKMDGEISVLPAKKGSREIKKNEIGVEFEIKLSDQEVYESVFMRKVGNGTVVLEVFALFTRLIRQTLELINRWVVVSRHISSLRCPLR
jgi:hypothetical protein